MTNESTKKKLSAAMSLIEEALAELGSSPVAKAKSNTVVASAPKTLSEHVLALREAKFFAEPRTEKETYEGVRTSYHCERKRVGVELLRLSRRRELRKASKTVEGKKLAAYVW